MGSYGVAEPVYVSFNSSVSRPKGTIHNTFIGKPFSTILYGFND